MPFEREPHRGEVPHAADLARVYGETEAHLPERLSGSYGGFFAFGAGGAGNFYEHSRVQFWATLTGPPSGKAYQWQAIYEDQLPLKGSPGSDYGIKTVGPNFPNDTQTGAGNAGSTPAYEVSGSTVDYTYGGTVVPRVLLTLAKCGDYFVFEGPTLRPNAAELDHIGSSNQISGVTEIDVCTESGIGYGTTVPGWSWQVGSPVIQGSNNLVAVGMHVQPNSPGIGNTPGTLNVFRPGTIVTAIGELGKVTLSSAPMLPAPVGSGGAITFYDPGQLALFCYPANLAQWGVVTNGLQEFAGEKHFSGEILTNYKSTDYLQFGTTPTTYQLTAYGSSTQGAAPHPIFRVHPRIPTDSALAVGTYGCVQIIGSARLAFTRNLDGSFDTINNQDAYMVGGGDALTIASADFTLLLQGGLTGGGLKYSGQVAGQGGNAQVGNLNFTYADLALVGSITGSGSGSEGWTITPNGAGGFNGLATWASGSSGFSSNNGAGGTTSTSSGGLVLNGTGTALTVSPTSISVTNPNSPSGLSLFSSAPGGGTLGGPGVTLSGDYDGGTWA